MVVELLANDVPYSGCKPRSVMATVKRAQFMPVSTGVSHHIEVHESYDYRWIDVDSFVSATAKNPSDSLNTK